jgi:hypothetical protein
LPTNQVIPTRKKHEHFLRPNWWSPSAPHPAICWVAKRRSACGRGGIPPPPSPGVAASCGDSRLGCCSSWAPNRQFSNWINLHTQFDCLTLEINRFKFNYFGTSPPGGTLSSSKWTQQSNIWIITSQNYFNLPPFLSGRLRPQPALHPDRSWICVRISSQFELNQFKLKHSFIQVCTVISSIRSVHYESFNSFEYFSSSTASVPLKLHLKQWNYSSKFEYFPQNKVWRLLAQNKTSWIRRERTCTAKQSLEEEREDFRRLSAVHDHLLGPVLRTCY